ncbi:hypothetical protein VTL71DRAFT_15649 [Oculimacula yallundae]|uniref:Uncharacterized protein n=1 Tax=Oculimacula yallundae TaxID=86028 RepID=A0ABR4CH67_9HELO
MILRPAKGSHICLRCQRGLVRQANASATQRASKSTNSKPPDYPGRRGGRFDIAAGSGADYLNKSPDGRGLGSALNQTKFRNEGSGRLYGHRGLQMQENRESLKNTTLGDPADVIVLRDSIISLYGAGGLRNMEAMEPEHIDILDKLEEERGLVGQKEVEGNIDELRPTNKRQTWEQFNELVNALQEGFTIPQLQRYIHNFEGRREPEPPQQEWASVKKTTRILSVTPWLPGVSEIMEYFESDPLRGYFLSSHTTKQRTAVQLLRECWMLEMPELVDGIGQFEIKVKKEDLELLLAGGNSFLDLVHSEHLSQEDERLEAFRKRGVIRVTAPQVKKRLIVQEIEGALHRVRRTTLHLAALKPWWGYGSISSRSVGKWIEKTFDSATLEELERLTNTSIIELEKHRLAISCIDADEHAIVSSVDVARRLLVTSSNLPTRVKYQMIHDKTKPGSEVFIKHEVGNTLPWKDRLRDWVRWTAPTTKEPEKNLEPIIAKPVFEPEPELGTQEDAAKLKAMAPGAKSSDAMHWSDKYFTETSALLGKVLYSHSDPSQALPVTAKANQNIHTFSEQAPNLTRIISKSNVQDGGEKADRLVLRFLPNPFAPSWKIKSGDYPDGRRPVTERAIGAGALVAFPTIEMHFKVDRETKHAKLYTVHAIAEESKTDVVLPRNNTDVRFQTRTTSRLMKNSIGPFRDYLEKSDLSLAGSAILQTPPSIRIPIDRHLCRGKGFSLLGEVDVRGTKIADTNAREVEYLFAALEVRSSLSFTYKSCRLLYTSIEAGKAGGKRSELKIRPMLGATITDQDQFFKMAYKLASEISNQDTESLVPAQFSKPRRVMIDVDPKVARRWRNPDHGPEAEIDLPYKNIAKRVSLTPGSLDNGEEQQEAEQTPVVKDQDDDGRRDEHAVAEKNLPSEPGNAQEKEDIEDDLKKIEDDKI